MAGDDGHGGSCYDPDLAGDEESSGSITLGQVQHIGSSPETRAGAPESNLCAYLSSLALHNCPWATPQPAGVSKFFFFGLSMCGAPPREAIIGYSPQLDSHSSTGDEGGNLGGNTQTAEPIANDWKAIHARMQEIKLEESAALRPCPRCRNRGWMPFYMTSRRSATTCDLCHNPWGLPPPRP
jgi:hypothetical protein